MKTFDVPTSSKQPHRKRSKSPKSPMCTGKTNCVHLNEEVMKILTDVLLKNQELSVKLLKMKSQMSAMQQELCRSNEESMKRMSEIVGIQQHISSDVIDTKTKMDSMTESIQQIQKTLNDIGPKQFDCQMNPDGHGNNEQKATTTIDIISHVDKPNFGENDFPSFDLGIDVTPKFIDVDVDDEFFSNEEVQRQLEEAFVTISESTDPDECNNQKKFSDTDNVIDPLFKFGTIPVCMKIWWHALMDTNSSLSDTHIDVCFYYIRQMAKYSTKVKIRATTTDCFFGFMITNAYRKFVADTIVLPKHSVLTSYVIGENFLLNTQWCDVDHVFFPILTPSRAHWILAQFDIKERLLYVFNSSQKTVRDHQIEEAVEPLSKIIHHLMVRSGFWKPKSATDREILEKLSIQIVKDIPQQENGLVAMDIFNFLVLHILEVVN
ncbi:uncharacterized protein Fot_07441 [Forsythia ovata]|uniref:Ubiquitin-like protease family profile domain-containing protein n=1 Tax=Forsythia ovata TaxID=205694 RepID=A0ABD1WVT9_9LAMI